MVGLYLGPPANAVILSLDEKSRIQASFDRTQPGLPLKRGRRDVTRDYVKRGTTTLFVAMNVLDGTVLAVIGRNIQRNRHRGFIRFLNLIERQTPAGKTIHAVVRPHAPQIERRGTFLCDPYQATAQALRAARVRSVRFDPLASILPGRLRPSGGFRLTASTEPFPGQNDVGSARIVLFIERVWKRHGVSGRGHSILPVKCHLQRPGDGQ